jgi:hypothetical protein
MADQHQHQVRKTRFAVLQQGPRHGLELMHGARAGIGFGRSPAGI